MRILLTTRPSFLVLTPCCVLLGVGSALWTHSTVDYSYLTLALLGALCAHVSVNVFNEYFDFRDRLDFITQRTPFSGGSGTLPQHPELANQAVVLAVASLFVTILIGSYFLSIWGWSLFPLGLLGLIVVVTYTPWVTRNPFVCLIAPGLGFGPFMVIGTHFVLTGEYSLVAFVASLTPFFLVNNLLLLNQFPDVEADRSVGRCHFPILLGKRKSATVFAIFTLLCFLSIAVGVLMGFLPNMALLGFLGILLAVPTVLGVIRYAENQPKLLPYMGMNVMLNLLTPTLVSVGLIMG